MSTAAIRDDNPNRTHRVRLRILALASGTAMATMGGVFLGVWLLGLMMQAGSVAFRANAAWPLLLGIALLVLAVGAMIAAVALDGGAWLGPGAQSSAEYQLRESEEQLKLAAEATGYGTFDYRPQTGKLIWSLATRRHFGLGPDAPVSHELFLKGLHPDDRNRVQRILQEALRPESGGHYQTEYRTMGIEDGRQRWILATGQAYFDEAGRPVRLVGATVDITERRKTEQDQAMRAAVVESSTDAIIGEGLDGTILSWNAGAQRLFGYTAEEAIGRSVSILIPETQMPLIEEHRDALQAGQTIRRQEVERIRKDGSRITISLSVSPIRDTAGRLVGVAKIAHDITDLKQAHEKLKAAMRSAEAAKAQAEQANRAKDQFLAVLSHELRTPLTPVVAGVSMLQEGVEDEQTARDALEMIHRNVEMEARLIDDLLDVTRIVRGKVELNRRPIPLQQMIQRSIEVCQPDIEGRHLHLGINLGACGQLLVNADAARLQQVFWNLIKNALKFTPHGGCIGIRCHTDGENVFTDVTDSGEGIDPQLLPHIFNPFEQGGARVTRQFGGLGLGLTITKGLVEMHGGSISAHSDGKGKGATFRVRLPIYVPAAAAPAHAADRAPAEIPKPGPTLTSKLRILLVEDHGDTANIMRRLLMARGHQVQVAGDVATALELAQSESFDLLLSDLGLPDGSGVELMRQLREHGRKLPGIALSGYGQEEDIRRSKEAGFQAHLTKPTSPDQLLETIGEVVGKGAS